MTPYIFRGCVVVLVLGVLRRNGHEREERRCLEAKARTALEDARQRIERAQSEAAKITARAQSEREQQALVDRAELPSWERRLLAREKAIGAWGTALESRSAILAEHERMLLDREQGVAADELAAAGSVAEAKRMLENIAGMTHEEAKRALIDRMLSEARHEAGKCLRQIEEDARREADRRAKRIITIAIERLAGGFVADRTVSVVHLPSDDIKGRIIGREGRNIRAIEAATGVDLIIDDAPQAITVSCHSPIRREAARTALERLVADGTIRPARIEEIVRNAETEVEENVREAGQLALFEVGVHGVHPEPVKVLGMLKYRYSYA